MVNVNSQDSRFCLFFDSHCHVQDPCFDIDRQDVLKRAKEILAGIVIVGDTLETSASAVRLAHDTFYAAVGIHPYHADFITQTSWEQLKQLASNEKVVAIGETGLDLSRFSKTSLELQQQAFLEHVALAQELRLPLIVHCRDAHKEMANVLKQTESFPGGVMHCFQGDESLLDLCLQQGWYISFAGNVTYPKADTLRNALKKVPLERLLLETDSPYLAPQAVRGKRCEPAFLSHTGAWVAEFLELPIETLARQTSENAMNLFQVSRH
ncbi:MAG TPA: TatD family hydrolase [Candidatus Hydrogenedentes bacterium]|nr:TatD family hydrolase [Candidatus Hydrogenedentota bacterium]HOL77690.1 TatD family hydrolase [Candidatus Hydrogenedentota bacterium]HPO86813.1 TatD family hydrolase [Candidatus Hydrogenedentota bacterium]